MLPHIPGGNIVKPQIEAPVGAEYGRFLMLRLLDPQGFQLFPAHILHIEVGAACHQVLYFLHVPDTADLLVIRKNFGVHSQTSFS